ncbi:MAG TPA: prolipoprotein diacylglyceryl transferase [Clostridiales bacterium]|nr:prolipoprotein diacylglyceryl transferase [Clostridiales bacterium]
MGDYTVVYFKAIERGFSVPSVLAEFSLFGLHFSIKMYGAIIAFGFLLAVLLGGRGAYKWKMSLDKMIDVLIYGTILGIIGARTYYVIANWSYYKGNLSEVFSIWEGGLAIYGGLMAAALGGFLVCKIEKLNFYNLMDLSAISFLLAQGIGRWGNFTNQEVFGYNTNLPWGMWSEKTAHFITANQAELAAKGISVQAGTMAEKAFVHPTFLYESILCLVGFVILYLVKESKYRKFSGQIMLMYGIWYGFGRGIIETFRLDAVPLKYIGLSLNQVRSFAIALVCAVWLAILLRKYIKTPKPIEGVDFFPPEDEPKSKKKKKGEASLEEAKTDSEEAGVKDDAQPVEETEEPAEEEPAQLADEEETQEDLTE